MKASKSLGNESEPRMETTYGVLTEALHKDEADFMQNGPVRILVEHGKMLAQPKIVRIFKKQKL